MRHHFSTQKEAKTGFRLIGDENQDFSLNFFLNLIISLTNKWYHHIHGQKNLHFHVKFLVKKVFLRVFRETGRDRKHLTSPDAQVTDARLPKLQPVSVKRGHRIEEHP